jgi:hypothetical protein
MNDEDRPTEVRLRTRAGDARHTGWALKRAFAEMFPEVLDPAAVEAAYAAEMGASDSETAVEEPDCGHLWCVHEGDARGPAWVTCGGCGLSVSGADWRDYDAEAWVQYVDPDGAQRAFARACGLPLTPMRRVRCP